MQTNKLLVSLGILMLAGFSSVQGEEISAPARAEIEKIVREYILQHPDVLMESVQAHRDRERVDAQKKSKGAVAANRRELFDDAGSPTDGAAGAEVTIVQFFDYKCGYCRRVSPTLSTLLEKHRNVRLIYKELPILGPESLVASRAALAAQKQGAYKSFHRELMNLGTITPETIEGAGKKLGLDVARLKADMNSTEIQAALVQNQRLANAIGVQSTPSFVIGGELISGAMDLAGFEQLISK